MCVRVEGARLLRHDRPRARGERHELPNPKMQHACRHGEPRRHAYIAIRVLHKDEAGIVRELKLDLGIADGAKLARRSATVTDAIQ
jgi:hypothetical protein